MKLQTFANTAKKSHCCIVITAGKEAESDEMLLSNGAAIYKCGCIPSVHGLEQICELLDIHGKQREKISITEEIYQSLDTIGQHFNLKDGETPDEADTERVHISVTYNGRDYAAVKCSDGELLFFHRELLAPLANEMTKNPYFRLTSRIADTGKNKFRYLLAKDGFATLAVILPCRLLSERFMKDLDEFTKDCVGQKQLEEDREKHKDEA